MAKNQVTVKEKSEVVASGLESEMFSSMDYGTTETKDLLIPKLLLMQGSSKFVKEDAICKPGDIVKSTTGEVYGSVREKDYKSVRVIPVFLYKTWVKQERVPGPSGGEKLQWIGTEPVTPMNTDQKWEQEIMGSDGMLHKYKLTKNINFYVLLEKDFGNPLAVPHVLTFRGTSARGAAVIEDWFAQCKAAQSAKLMKDSEGHLMLPFAKVFEVGGKMEKNDNDSWFVLNTKESGWAPEAVIPQAFNWYKTVSKSEHKDVDNSDEKGEASMKTVNESTVPF